MWCRNPHCALETTDPTCRECGWGTHHSIYGLPLDHPVRKQYEQPTPVRREVTGTLAKTQIRAHRKAAWRAAYIHDDAGHEYVGVLPKAIEGAPIGSTVTLEADVTPFNPQRSGYRRPKDARIVEGSEQ